MSLMSHSLRSAWIEICWLIHYFFFRRTVALLTECVDRNISEPFIPDKVNTVALLTECVDRNRIITILPTQHKRRTPYGVRG